MALYHTIKALWDAKHITQKMREGRGICMDESTLCGLFKDYVCWRWLLSLSGLLLVGTVSGPL